MAYTRLFGIGGCGRNGGGCGGEGFLLLGFLSLLGSFYFSAVSADAKAAFFLSITTIVLFAIGWLQDRSSLGSKICDMRRSEEVDHLHRELDKLRDITDNLERESAKARDTNESLDGLSRDVYGRIEALEDGCKKTCIKG